MNFLLKMPIENAKFSQNLKILILKVEDSEGKLRSFGDTFRQKTDQNNTIFIYGMRSFPWQFT
jgi:hypothetical protein